MGFDGCNTMSGERTEGFVMTWVPRVELHLLTLPGHLRSPTVFGGVCVAVCDIFVCLFCSHIGVKIIEFDATVKQVRSSAL